MAVTATRTVRDIVTRALRKSRVVGVNQDPTSWDAKTAMHDLDDMLKEWQSSGFNLWTWTEGTKTLTTAVSYDLAVVRPISIMNVRYKGTDGVEVPMVPLTRWEYDSISDKDSTGTPSQFHYDRQREAAKLYIWPALASATTESIEFTYQREVEDITSLNDTIDMPGEWWSTVVYNLASRLIDTYALENPGVQARAEQLFKRQMAFDREGSVYFNRGENDR